MRAKPTARLSWPFAAFLMGLATAASAQTPPGAPNTTSSKTTTPKTSAAKTTAPQAAATPPAVDPANDPLCRAMGKGFQRIPGTSTCMKASGSVQMDGYQQGF